jgi:hypothetical protein
MHARRLVPLMVALVAGKLALDHFSDPDLYWHLRNGADILALRGFPKTIEHAWPLVGATFSSNDWIPEVGMAAVLRLLGVYGLAMVKGIAAAVYALVLYRAAKERSGGDACPASPGMPAAEAAPHSAKPRLRGALREACARRLGWVRRDFSRQLPGNVIAAGIATLALLFVAATHFGTRPSLCGYTLLALELILLERAVKGARWAPPLLLPLFALWFNTHGTWALGLGPLGATAASALLPKLKLGRLRAREVEPATRWWLIGWAIVAPLGVFATPFGIDYVLRPFQVIYSQAKGHKEIYGVLEEWMPVPLSTPPAWVLIAAILLVAWACLRSKKELPIFDLALLAAVAVMAMTTARYHIAFATLATPLFAEQLSGRVSADGLARTKLNAILAAMAVPLLLAITAFRVWDAPREIRRTMPERAVQVLKTSGFAKERGFNYFDWGGYLLYSNVDTFVDGRSEKFFDGVFQRYIEVESKADLAWLESQDVRWILERPENPLAAAVDESEGWSEAFRDERSVLWLRQR